MNKNIKWYVLLALSSLFLIGYFIYGTSSFRDTLENLTGDFDNNGIRTDESFNTNQFSSENQLPIPVLLEDQNPEEGKAEFTLDVQYGKTEFIEGYEADTLGYNGDYLGPVIRVNRGDEVKINVNNELADSTTVHWHGLEVIGEMDGGPHQGIAPNKIGRAHV